MSAAFASASAWAGDKYIYVHPNSEMGNPNYADELGYELVAVRPDGCLIYRLANLAQWRRWKKDQKS